VAVAHRSAQLTVLVDETDGDDEPTVPAERPRLRAECIGGMRPCPWVSCRYHLAVVRVDRNGGMRVFARNLPMNADADLAEAYVDGVADAIVEMVESCALDIAERDGGTLEEVGQALGVTRECAGQIESGALGQARSRRTTRLLR
jgi:hypothetical protein